MLNTLFIFLSMLIIFCFMVFGNLVSSFEIIMPEKLNINYFKLDRSYNFIRDFGYIIIENWSKGDFYLGDRGDFFDTSAQYYDPSLVGRLQQWGRYLDIINNSEFKTFAILFGSGPGSGGIINDGMYIKILVELYVYF